MKFPFKTLTLTAIAFAIFAVTYISCTKDNNKSTTVIKCVTCVNGGACINDTCRCPAGFEGLTCQTLSIEKYIGQWFVSETGSITSFHQYSIQIQQAFNSITNVSISGLYEPYPPFSFSSLTANINGDSIFIPSQPMGNGIIIGKGYLTPGNNSTQFSKITFRYKVTDTIANTVNDFGYSNPIDSPSVWNFN